MVEDEEDELRLRERLIAGAAAAAAALPRWDGLLNCRRGGGWDRRDGEEDDKDCDNDPVENILPINKENDDDG